MYAATSFEVEAERRREILSRRPSSKDLSYATTETVHGSSASWMKLPQAHRLVSVGAVLIAIAAVAQLI